jgi:tetratricopeptide (TPR) repeat protein
MAKKTVWEFPGEESSFSEYPQIDGKMARCINFNNQGVTALNQEQYELAITKFVESLKIDPQYQLARDNLATTYNNYGIKLCERPRDALKQFHLAFSIDPLDVNTIRNIEGIIRMMGMNPNSFNDRITLAEHAGASGDFAGAVIEYQAALQIKDDPAQRQKLISAQKILKAAAADQFPLTLFRPAESEKAIPPAAIDQH